MERFTVVQMLGSANYLDFYFIYCSKKKHRRRLYVIISNFIKAFHINAPANYNLYIQS